MYKVESELKKLIQKYDKDEKEIDDSVSYGFTKEEDYVELLKEFMQDVKNLVKRRVE